MPSAFFFALTANGIRRVLNKTHSPLMVEIEGKYALIYATDVAMRLMFGSWIRVAYNVLQLPVRAGLESTKLSNYTEL